MLAERQLAAQRAAAEHLDTLALGLLAFVGALIAAEVAAQSDLGARWWWPLVGLGISAGFCTATIVAREELSIGPDPAGFYEKYGGLPVVEANVVLLADLRKAADTTIVQRKEDLFSLAFGVLFLTAIAAPIIFAVHW